MVFFYYMYLLLKLMMLSQSEDRYVLARTPTLMINIVNVKSVCFIF